MRKPRSHSWKSRLGSSLGRRQASVPGRRLQFEPLEGRLLLSVAPFYPDDSQGDGSDPTVKNFVDFETTQGETGIPPWLEQGPAAIGGGQVLISPDNPVAGAIEAVAVHPFDADVMFIGSVNGGIWRTTDGGASWTPLTDQFPSLSIGDVTISPLDADGNPVRGDDGGTPTDETTAVDKLVVYAGTGKFSSYGNTGGYNVGLYKSTDGGETWALTAPLDLAGLDITAVVPTQNLVDGEQVVLVSALSKMDGSGTVLRQGGIFRSTDGGGTFERIVDGEATDLKEDAGDQNRFYAGVRGEGVLITTDGGAGWTPTPTQPAGAVAADRIMLSVQNSNGAGNAVFAAPIDNGRALGVYRSPDQGGNWTVIGAIPDINPGQSGNKHFSMIADASGTRVYVGGDRSNAAPWVGNIHVGDSTSNTWTEVVKTGANNTAPHADSRDMVFDSNGDLIETDDGGIYRLTNPTAGSRTWQSLNGDLRITESLSAAYDPLNNVIFTGNQDNGSTVQSLARVSGNPDIGFAHAASDTITRSAGSWIADGFRRGTADRRVRSGRQ